MEMDIRKATSQRILELCSSNDMIQADLIKETGLPPSTIKSIIHGQSKNPGIVNLAKIAGGFGMSIREFFDSDAFDHILK